MHLEINADDRERFWLYNACRPMQITAVRGWDQEEALAPGMSPRNFHSLVESRLQEAGLLTRTQIRRGELPSLPRSAPPCRCLTLMGN